MGQPDIITDHAFVRWLERVYGLDVEALKSSMVDETIAAAAETGASAVKRDGLKYVFAGGRVVTVLTKEQRVKRKDRRHVVDLDFDATNGNGATPGPVRMQKDNAMLNVDQKTEAGKTNGLFSDEQIAVLKQTERCNDQHKITSRVVELTPAKAKALLAKNFDNRAVSETRVQQYAADISEGRWTLNGEPLIVADTGELNDGQHRCAAVVAANKSIMTLMVEGVPRDARLTTDMGYARTAGHFFGMNGVKDSNNIAAAASMLLQIETFGESKRGRDGNRFTKQQIFEYGNRHLDELEWASDLVSAPRCSKFRRSVLMTALIILARKAGPGTADAFIRAFVTGENLGRRDPIYVARERILAEVMAKTFTNHKAFEILFRAWNAHRKGKTMTRMPVRGEWPEISR